MKLPPLVLVLCSVGAVASLAAAQPPPSAVAPTPQAPRPAPPAAGMPAPAPAPNVSVTPQKRGQPVNIKVDVTISDQPSGGAPALKKTVSVVTGDAMNGLIRTNAWYENVSNPVPLNVDAEPEILADGKIRVRVNVQYDLPAFTRGGDAPAPALRRTELRENLSLILESGKPIIATQSADPVSDRQVTIEVKATILK